MLSKKVILNVICEFGPVAAFMATYALSDFENATYAVIGAVIIALLLLKYTEGHYPLFAIISTASVVLFGAISLYVHIPTIFILRDTLFDLVFGTILLISVFKQKPLLQHIFKHVFRITAQGWKLLTLRWGIFFIILAAINEYIRLTVSPDTWVHAKVYLIAATLIFGFYQFRLTEQEKLPEAGKWGIIK